MISANALDVWDKIPYEWAEFYEMQIDRGIMNESRVKERLEQHIEDMTDTKTNIKGILLGIWCWALHLDYVTIQQELGFINSKPKLEKPQPADEHDNIAVDTEKVFISINDSEGDEFNVRIFGDYVIEKNYPMGQKNGTFNATLIHPYPHGLPYGAEIIWKVQVQDVYGRWVNDTFMFKTRWK
jgi:hypothetical protein